jgi:glycosyltransferase involved in cell wall biosynthesis
MRVLMVSTEYPPMPGGVGRYTAKLTQELRNLGLDVYVVCNEHGKGDFYGLSPTNKLNSETLMGIVNETKPDVVHIQFEPGLYGLLLDPKNPRKSGTYIDSFYEKCQVPITTTFHSGYNLTQWISQASLIKKSGRIGKLGIPLRGAIRFWKYFLNYKAFKDLNKEKLRKSKAGIVFSSYMSKMIGGGEVIYHGAEPAIFPKPNKKEARRIFSLPSEGHIALALGFQTVTKGWDILKKMKVPAGWQVVLNSSKGHYNLEKYDMQWIEGSTIIDLHRGYLTDEQLSILFYSSDALLMPYKVSAGSGVMFDAIAHGIPFIATDLAFFNEFAAKGLGITVKREANQFSNGIKKLEKNYVQYAEAVEDFKKNLRWNFIARQHATIYFSVANKKSYQTSDR